MRKIKYISLSIITILLLTFPAYSQKLDTIEISVSTQCNMCKDIIEKNLSYERGLKTFDVDYKAQKLFVIYDPRKTNPEKIRLAVSKTGYDADHIFADPKAYSNLPGCCKKPDDPDHHKH